MLGRYRATRLAAALALGRWVPGACMVGPVLAVGTDGASWQLVARPRGAKQNTIYYFDAQWQLLRAVPSGGRGCGAGVRRKGCV